MKAGSWLQYAHMALFCQKKLNVFQSTLLGLKLVLEVLSRVQGLGLKSILNVEEIEERLTGSIKAGTWLQFAHMALVCP